MDRFITLAIDTHRSSIGIERKRLAAVFGGLMVETNGKEANRHTHTLEHTNTPIHAIAL